MRIRTIKPEFWQNETIATLPEFTRLLAIALLNYADDHGYFMANHKLIAGNLFPFEDDSEKILRSIQELSSVDYLELGVDSKGRKVARIVNFEKHQRVDKPKASIIKGDFIIQDTSKTHPRIIQDASCEEGNGKGMEKEMNREGETSEKSSPPQDFEKSSKPESTDQIIVRINAVRPMWSKAPHLTSQEQHDLFTAIDGIRQITEEQWASLARWAASPDGKDDWTIKTRSRFIANYSEALMKAGDWSAGELKPQPHLDLGGRRAASRMTFES